MLGEAFSESSRGGQNEIKHKNMQFDVRKKKLTHPTSFLYIYINKHTDLVVMVSRFYFWVNTHMKIEM